MSQDFENKLREALRPIEPEERFAERILAKLEAEPAPAHSSRYRWYAAGLAASIAIGSVLVYDWHLQREAQGLAARQQLIEALRVTGEKLDIAYQAVNNEAHRDGSGGA